MNLFEILPEFIIPLSIVKPRDISKFSELPKYIIIYILEYGEEIRYRTGIYINRFSVRNKFVRIIRNKLLNMYMKEYADGKYSIILPITKKSYLFICTDYFENKELIYIMKFKWITTQNFIVNNTVPYCVI